MYVSRRARAHHAPPGRATVGVLPTSKYILWYILLAESTHESEREMASTKQA